MKRKIAMWLAVGVVAIVAVLVLAMPAPAVREGIDSTELLRLQSAGASVIDVRTPGEFEAGHIASAVNVPLDQLSQDVSTWDKDRAVVVYCATGARSADAAAYLASQGFRKVYDLEKGVVSWTGELVGGPSAASVPTGAVKTDGKRLFIEFSTST